jgi:hypothetical protein
VGSGPFGPPISVGMAFGSTGGVSWAGGGLSCGIGLGSDWVML